MVTKKIENSMSEQKAVENSSHGRKKLWFLLVLIVSAALIGGGYFGITIMINKIAVAVTLAEKSSDNSQQLQTKLHQLQDTMQNLQDEIQKMHDVKTSGWKPHIIEHLIRMADITLHTTGNPKLAVDFLSAAKQYASDQALSAINYALNKDIASLQNVAMVDPEVLILKIEELQQKISLSSMTQQQLQKAPSMPSIKESEEHASTAKNLWENFFTNALNALKSIVVIHHHTTEPLLWPEQATILQSHIQTKLLQTELAVIHRQNKLYQSYLAEVTKMVSRYFAANPEAIANILPAIQELQQVDLQPKLPPLINSLNTIADFTRANFNKPVGQNTQQSLSEMPIKTTISTTATAQTP